MNWAVVHEYIYARFSGLRDLSVKTKIIGAFALVLAATVALGLFAADRMWVMNTQASAIGTDWFPSAKLTHELSYLTSRVRLKEATYLLETSDEAREMRLREVRMLDAKIATALAEILRLASDDDQRRLAGELKKKWAAYREQENELVKQQATDSVSAFVFFTGEYKNTFDEFRNVLDQIVAADNRAGEAEIEASAAEWRWGRLCIGLALLTAIVLCIGAGVVLIGAVSAPLGRITDAMETLAAGDLAVEVPHAGQADEIGKLAGVMTSYKNRLAAADRSKAEQTEAIVSSIGAGLDHLAKGDLAWRITADLDGPFVKLKGDFNEAMGRLGETMRAVLVTTDRIAEGADGIARSADDLARRTEHQAASLEETAAALQQITVTVRQSAASTRQVDTGMARAKTAAEEGGHVVQATTRAMDAIAHSSSRITDIIGVIDEIAFQTNLLALNAGVEAARAGDAGRGFAVVAGEVRALAQRSSLAAKEIKSLIQESGAEVAGGVKLVAETGKALAHIVEVVNQINTAAGEMAHAAEQEALGIEEVNAAVGQMDEVTQQNAAMVDETTAASRALAAETQELQTQIGFFNLGTPHRTIDLQPSTRRPVVGRSAGAPTPKLRATAGTSPQAPTADDSWEEF